jgi:hypothetical protein
VLDAASTGSRDHPAAKASKVLAMGGGGALSPPPYHNDELNWTQQQTGGNSDNLVDTP